MDLRYRRSYRIDIVAVWFSQKLYKLVNELMQQGKNRKKVKKENKSRVNNILANYAKIGKMDNIREIINLLDAQLNKIIGQQTAKVYLRENFISIMYKFFHSDLIKNKKSEELKNKLKDVITEMRKNKCKKKEIKKKLLKYSYSFTKENPEVMKIGPGTQILLLYGPPGVGKTEGSILASMCLAEDNKNPYIIDYSTIMMHGSLFSNLLKSKKLNEKNNSPDEMLYSDLYTYIRSIQRGVIIVNEADKILADSAMKKDFNEFLRTLIDNDYFIDEQGNKIDCSGLVWILTSNGKVKKGEIDTSGGMTENIFDPSFSTRIIKIPYKNFEYEDHVNLIKQKFDKVKNNFESDYNENIKINFTESLYNILGKYIYETEDLRNTGARCINGIYKQKLESKLFEILECDKSFENFKNTEINIDYNQDINNFTLSIHNDFYTKIIILYEYGI